jgi:hypothetical protein
MDERGKDRIWAVLSWTLSGVAVLVWLPFLVLIVLWGGAALGLWQINDR